MDKPRRQRTVFFGLTLRVIKIAVMQTLPEKFEVGLAPTLKELWMSDLNVFYPVISYFYNSNVSMIVHHSMSWDLPGRRHKDNTGGYLPLSFSMD